MSRTAAGVEALETLEIGYQEARATLEQLKRRYREEKSFGGVDAAAASHPVYGRAAAAEQEENEEGEQARVPPPRKGAGGLVTAPLPPAPSGAAAADTAELQRRLEVAEIMTRKYSERNKELELALEEERARNPWAPNEAGGEEGKAEQAAGGFVPEVFSRHQGRTIARLQQRVKEAQREVAGLSAKCLLLESSKVRAKLEQAQADFDRCHASCQELQRTCHLLTDQLSQPQSQSHELVLSLGARLSQAERAREEETVWTSVRLFEAEQEACNMFVEARLFEQEATELKGDLAVVAEQREELRVWANEVHARIEELEEENKRLTFGRSS
mmetsp:Transcript_104558/g.301417  ORF Transcript_104558/g.301417 Transcript_104558/m.301417 type:complete len:329 (+) Transcript_104558:56-1042(+)